MAQKRTRSIASIPRRNVARSPIEFNKLGSLGLLKDMGWAKLPTYYYDVTQFRFPLTPAEFDQQFSGIRKVFSLLDPQAGTGRQTNAATGSGVNEVFVALGAGIVAIGEDLNTSIPGVAMDRPAAPACTPLVDGCVTRNRAVAGDLGVGARNASLWYGGPTWRFIDKLFNHYRLQIYANRRFQMVDESLFDVGMVPAPPEFIGASDSSVPRRPFIRATNDVMADKGIDKVFLEQLTEVGPGSGCVTTQLSPATWGHPRITGLANRIYCFYQPLVMIPGMQFDVELVPVENDICNLDDMEAVSTLDPDAPVTQDAILTENFCNATGQNDGFASEFMIPGGCVHLGVVLKGIALQPQACIEYLVDYVMGGNRSLLAELYQGGNLAGLGNVLSYLEGLDKVKFGSAGNERDYGDGKKARHMLAGYLAQHASRE